ncbi:MAG: TIGR04211 family SH3 domain-containing protein [Gammaproteobacteria bacterium]|nr:TIGR04211 family SH3 domain-containing protein [Gammaproteobacteria bacterium]
MYKFVVSILLSSLLFSAEIQAQTRYVADQLIITIRSGQGSQHKIIKTITTGTKMTLLEEFPETGYARVTLEDGTEGWVRTQYLTDKPVAKAQLEWFKDQYKKLKDSQAGIQEELNTLKKVEKEHNALQARMKRLSEAAAKPILLDKENRELKEQNVTLTNEMQLISQENQILKDRSDRDWFVAGGGVMVVGILLGLFLPKLRPSKKSGWSGSSL